MWEYNAHKYDDTDYRTECGEPGVEPLTEYFETDIHNPFSVVCSRSVNGVPYYTAFNDILWEVVVDSDICSAEPDSSPCALCLVHAWFLNNTPAANRKSWSAALTETFFFQTCMNRSVVHGMHVNFHRPCIWLMSLIRDTTALTNF